MFQIKDFLSICASMVNHMRGTQTEITDYNVGGVARTLIEAPAIEIDQLYQQMFIGLREAIPVSTYNSFGFARIPAQSASGIVRFAASPHPIVDLVISAGTVVRVPGASTGYITAADAIITAGSAYIDILVYAQTPGTAGNVAANTITQMDVPIPNITVTNLAAFSNGVDVETDDNRKLRFQRYITTIARGTVAALAYGAKTTEIIASTGAVLEQVKSVNIIEPYLVDPVTYPPALVWVAIHNGVGATSGALVTLCQQIIDGYVDATGTPIPGYKAAGVIAVVMAVGDIHVNVAATLTVATGYSAVSCRAAVADAVAAYLSALDVGQPALIAELVASAMAVPGVYNVVFSSPAGDVAITNIQKALPGTVAIS